jgi:hypothetical protein
MTNFVTKVIIDELRLVQIEYDVKGYLDTNDADTIIKHCQSLIKVVEEQREEIKGFKEFLHQTSDIDKRADALIKEQAEKIERYEKILLGISLNEDNASNHLWAKEALNHQVSELDKKTVSKILAYVEKNHDAPEIEEYLWKMLDKGTEFE